MRNFTLNSDGQRIKTFYFFRLNLATALDIVAMLLLPLSTLLQHLATQLPQAMLPLATQLPATVLQATLHLRATLLPV